MTVEEFKPYRETLPNQPGIYKYINEQGEIIYIGKAKDLRKRVSSYFVNSQQHTNRIKRMIHFIKTLEFVIVDTEQDAFLLENSLIKKYQPRYNVMLKDDKTYPFICIKNEPFPRVFFTRKVIKDGSEYLGPYTSVFNAHIVLDLMKEIFPLRTCNLNLAQKNIEAGKFKVCLEYHLKNCLGPCQSLQTAEDYEEEIQQIRNILKSNFGSVKNYLKKKMNSYAEQMQFEKAEEFRKAGNALFEGGNYPGAVKEYTEGLRRDPNSKAIFSNRCAAYIKLMEFPTALKDAEKCLALDPTFVKAWARKGTIHHAMKEYHKALDCFDKGLKLDPENKDCKEGRQKTLIAV